MSRRGAILAGIGGWTPPRVVTNDELAVELDTSDEWIRTRTGIRRRHVVDPGTATGELAVEAGRRALTSAGATQVDVVVVATSTPDRSCPATAPRVASRLGLRGVPAFDISAVCSGFVYALAVAQGLIVAGKAESCLVIGSDTFSTILDPSDRSTRAVFGDGAGAAVLRAGMDSEVGALLGLDWGSDGDGHDLITVRAGGSEQRSGVEAPAPGEEYFAMNGRVVFARAVRHMVESTRCLLDDLGWAVSDVDRFVAHQANERILTATAARIGLALDNVVVALGDVGNTVAASIPLALVDAAVDGKLHQGDRTILCGFGGGLTWGAVALRWPTLKVESAH